VTTHWYGAAHSRTPAHIDMTALGLAGEGPVSGGLLHHSEGKGEKGVQRGAKGDERCVRSNVHVGNLSIDAGRGTAQ